MEGSVTVALSHSIERISKILSIISGVALTFVIAMTVLDVLGRSVGYPILGTYEIIGFSGAFLIGCSMAFTSVTGSHVYMAFLIEKLPSGVRKMLDVATRIICIMLFGIISINLFQIAAEFRRAGEISAILKIPVYPFAYAFGICCIIQCVVFIADAIRIWESKGENL